MKLNEVIIEHKERSKREYIEFHLEISSKGILLPCTVGKTTCKFLIDTGSNISCLDYKVLEDSNFKLKAHGEVKNAYGVDDHPIYLGDLSFKQGQRKIVFPKVELYAFDQDFGDGAYGLIGRELMKNFTIEYDGKHERAVIRVYRPDKNHH